jgi:TubC N-terminal docking domain
LRECDVLLEADGLTLHVDAPAEALTDELRTALRENKHALIRDVERERLSASTSLYDPNVFFDDDDLREGGRRW